MIRRTFFLTLALVTLTFAAGARAHAEPLIAYNNPGGGGGSLLSFDSLTPGVVAQRTITGLATGEELRGIDIRPANGLLYALTNQSRIYTINPTTGAATFVSTLSTPLDFSENFFGVDFNPNADRLRVISSGGQNLRINVDTGATIVDGTITPLSVTPTGAAYTNNFAGASSTTLYGIDAGVPGGRLFIQNPPNAGTTQPVGTNLGIGGGTASLSGFEGFDISGQTGIAYLTDTQFNANNIPFSVLYSVNLTTGTATLIGTIGTGAFTIEGLAAQVGVGSPVPEPATLVLLGTGLAGVVAKRRRRSKQQRDEAV